jgi:hypothetical protein
MKERTAIEQRADIQSAHFSSTPPPNLCVGALSGKLRFDPRMGGRTDGFCGVRATAC